MNLGTVLFRTQSVSIRACDKFTAKNTIPAAAGGRLVAPMRRSSRLRNPVVAGVKRIVVLGSTGSIGTNTLDVVTRLPEQLRIFGLSAHRSFEKLVDQANVCQPRFVTVTDADSAKKIKQSDLPKNTQLLTGEAGVRQMVSDPQTDMVVAAMVGAAGLTGTWSALEAGKIVALANKETLVVAGQLVTELAARHGGQLLPIDSEHSAIFQAVSGGKPSDVRRVVLTASGGPFRGKTRRQLEDVTPTDALNHPTWKMGKKVTIDSATLMNKALEIIEARWLFDLPPEKIEVVIHPESLVHSFVEFVDGSVIAQLSPPDMRLPIQYALTYPERLPSPARKLDWSSLGTIHFEQPDRATFPALDLGFEVARQGGTSGAVLNAANEAAVHRFLAGELRFLDIPRVCREVLDHHDFSANPSLEELWSADRQARHEVNKWIHAKTALASRR
jgi:1-deoxy-D-xylulose-5-phosphate reductoisomerase